MTPHTLNQFNQLAPEQQRALLLDCCHSSRWAERLLELGPVRSVGQIQNRAFKAWSKLQETDYLEAFAAHPRIGDLQRLKEKFARSEQGQVAHADETTLKELQQLNDAYFEKFGFIFIICATGKSAREMLAAIKSRISNSREQEIGNAAAEQEKITRLRLENLFAVQPDQ
ncbi:2-oxo-4-hydroxy-4-carboxy-5-ureidoimidazoline decarboxylase [Microbulbifer aggregans]|uniref:2-oxo-4-hydroxy-4-carboxy-5-ureidoimidazoline decarboxylase n=1 Tax=Microbulbifer aggregans TaxID=1769779 RepID=UPI001CFDC55B|nr:2-oxo-4-hydroxy-4-carboxy-5-ureidoimidazoline decarboxylase [Microbulbifer aggregans]